MHWHGQHHVATPYMDGVPYVSQCPIPPGATFQYNYIATEAGTHFWHSHTGTLNFFQVFVLDIICRKLKKLNCSNQQIHLT